MASGGQDRLNSPSLSEAELRDAYRQALEESGQVGEVSNVPDDVLALQVRTKGGRQVMVNLQRLHSELVGDLIEDRRRRFEDQVATTIEAARLNDGQFGAPTRDQLIPMIKGTAWMTATRGNDLAVEIFVADLYIVYAFDRTSTITYARIPDLEAMGLEPAEARRLAIENLTARLPRDIGTRGDGKSFLFTGGGNYEASLILVDKVWDGLAAQFKGDMIACVLARDVCLFTSTSIAGGVESLVAARNRVFAGLTPGDVISTTLLRRQQGCWAVFETAT